MYNKTLKEEESNEEYIWPKELEVMTELKKGEAIWIWKDNWKKP